MPLSCTGSVRLKHETHNDGMYAFHKHTFPHDPQTVDEYAPTRIEGTLTSLHQRW